MGEPSFKRRLLPDTSFRLVREQTAAPELPRARCVAFSCLATLAAFALISSPAGTLCPHHAAPIRVACLGDSLTAGDNSHFTDWELVSATVGRWRRPLTAPPNESAPLVLRAGYNSTVKHLREAAAGRGNYPLRLQDLLGPRFAVRNFGVGGVGLCDESATSTAELHEQAALLREWRPAIVYVLLGTNDAVHTERCSGGVAQGVRRGLADVLAAVRPWWSPPPLVVHVQPPPLGPAHVVPAAMRERWGEMVRAEADATRSSAALASLAWAGGGARARAHALLGLGRGLAGGGVAGGGAAGWRADGACARGSVLQAMWGPHGWEAAAHGAGLAASALLRPDGVHLNADGSLLLACHALIFLARQCRADCREGGLEHLHSTPHMCAEVSGASATPAVVAHGAHHNASAVR